MLNKVYLKIYSMMVLLALMALLTPVVSAGEGRAGRHAREGLLIYEDWEVDSS